MDLTTLLGIVIGVGSIYLGHDLSGRVPPSVAAALIVLGGTLGAVITQFPLRDLGRALRQLRWVFASDERALEPVVQKIVEASRLARRDGLLALEKLAKEERDPFTRRAFDSLIDGLDSTVLREQLLIAADQAEQLRTPGPRFFDAMGGYAPTIGILGAVLGLIHVMQQLGEPTELGAGIAVAFVATVYGVGSANLIFLPLAGKLKLKIATESRRHELVVEGVCAIQDGLNPQLIERRLRLYLDEQKTLRPKKGARRRR